LDSDTDDSGIDTGMPDDTESAALVAKFLRLVDRGEWNGLSEFYSTDAVVSQPFAKPERLVLRGREAIRAHFLAAAHAPIRLRVVDLIIRTTSDPEVVIAEYDYEAEATKSGRRFVVANIQVFHIRRGQIVASRDFHDHAAFASALRP
jgi:ketosteroid isomerase-like protein